MNTTTETTIALTRADYAAAITASWRDSVGGIVETGRRVLEAKGGLNHGEFGKMFELREVPFGERTGQRLKSIAESPTLSNPTNWSLLPASWRTLYECTTLGEEMLAACFAAGRIQAETTIADVAKLLGKGAHVAHNSGDNEWYTPAEIIEAARTVMGGIDLDPASSEIANKCVGATRIFTEQDDGLKQEWPMGRIWMNPPYAQPLIGQFSERFAAEIQRGSTGIVLVNNATETAWFQDLAQVCSVICFPKSRVRFLDPEGEPGAPLQGQAILYCGPDHVKFADSFKDFGLVVFHRGEF